ncbi:GAF domain-containing protein [Deinococcus malanensis]|uniref:GAF domain-containing protein n=1 Tax=Deinococcus malanensis TaxID=1706855 RepID=UPI00362CE6F8
MILPHELPVPASVVTLLQATPDVIFTLDHHGVITYANPPAAGIVGLTPAEVVGLHLERDFPHTLSAEFPSATRRALDTGVPVEYTVFNAFVGRWLRGHVLPMSDGLVVQIRDITALHRAEQLHRVTAALGAARTEKDVVQAVLDQAVPAVGAYRGAVMALSDDQQTLELLGEVGYAPEERDRFGRLALERDLPVCRAAQDGTPVFTTMPDATSEFADWNAVRSAQTQSLVALPLTFGGAVQAVLVLSFEVPRRFDESERQFLTTLTGVGTQALERARLFDAEHQGRVRATLLAEAGTLLASSLKVEDTLERLTALALEHVADWAAVYLPNDDGIATPVAVAHRDPALVELLRAFVSQYPADPESPGSTAWVMRTGESFLLPVVPAALIDAIEDLERRAAIVRMGFHSLIHVPLIVAGRTVGVLGLASSSPARTYGPEDLRLAEALAARAALALENAALFKASQHNEQRYRSLIDATRQIVWTTTPDGQLLGEQPGWTKLTGQRENEYCGYGWVNALHPDDRARSVAAWQAAIEQRAVYTIQHRVQVAGSTYRHFDVRGVPVLNADGTIREWVGCTPTSPRRCRPKRNWSGGSRSARKPSRAAMRNWSGSRTSPRTTCKNPAHDRGPDRDVGTAIRGHLRRARPRPAAPDYQRFHPHEDAARRPAGVFTPGRRAPDPGTGGGHHHGPGSPGATGRPAARKRRSGGLCRSAGGVWERVSAHATVPEPDRERPQIPETRCGAGGADQCGAGGGVLAVQCA